MSTTETRPKKRGGSLASPSYTDEPQSVPEGHIELVLTKGTETEKLPFPPEQAQRILQIQQKSIKRNPALKPEFSLPEDSPYEFKDGVLHPRASNTPDKGATE